MNKNKRLILIIEILLLIIVVLLMVFFVKNCRQSEYENPTDSTDSAETEPDTDEVPDTTEEADTTEEPDTQYEESTAPEDTTNDIVIDPSGEIDFTAIQSANPDIFAWIRIPGANVDYPVLQHPTSDDFYLNHASDKSYYIGGSLFTQKTYNSKGLDDPCTIIYGHYMSAGTLFGSLQSFYSNPENFNKNNQITVLTPEHTYTYTVFAAVPFPRWHILYNYDFGDERDFRRFFRYLTEEVRDLSANKNPDLFPEYGEKVLILSTCLRGGNEYRYLVMAKLTGIY